MSCSLIPILSEANSRRETDVSVIYCVFKKSKIKCMADIKLSSWDSLRESTIISTALMTGFPGGANSKEPTCQCRRCKMAQSHKIRAKTRKSRDNRLQWPWRSTVELSGSLLFCWSLNVQFQWQLTSCSSRKTFIPFFLKLFFDVNYF